MLVKLDREKHPISKIILNVPLAPASISTQNELANHIATEFAYTWAEFEIALNQVPIIQRILDGSITKEDVMQMQLTWRQQVVDGATWFAQSIASFNIRDFPEYTMIRELLTSALTEEHTDYRQIERDYVGLGGTLDDIQNHPQNLGTFILSSFLVDQARKENPVHIFGASFIIEGMGKVKAGPWGDKVDTALELDGKYLSFLNYHATADQVHHSRISMLFGMPFMTEKIAEKLIKTARATASLYVDQFAYLYDC